VTKRIVLATIVAASTAAGQASAQNPADEADGCEPLASIEFSMDSALTDLEAESDLASAANWVMQEPGRYLMVLGPTGPLPSDVQIGMVRVNAAMTRLFQLGVNPYVVMSGTYDELSGAEQHALRSSDSIVVMTCVPVPPPFGEEAIQ
jgi:hypothetical protein